MRNSTWEFGEYSFLKSGAEQRREESKETNESQREENMWLIQGHKADEE